MENPLKKARRKFTIVKTYSIHLIGQFSRSQIAVNVKMRFGVIMPKMNPNGLGFESASDQITIFQIKYTKIVKSMLDAVKSTAPVTERWSHMTIHIEFPSENVDFTFSFFECSMTNKTQLKFVENLPFGMIYSFLGAISDFDAILDFRIKEKMA
jgi:hypothetical protein